MYSTRCQALMTQGFALSNKLHFREWNPDEFRAWIDDCERLLSNCDQESGFPWFPGTQHIEEIVAILGETRRKISRGQIRYTGLL